MTDYYGVLLRAMAKVDAPSDAERARIYDHVRTVMLRQLNGREPPLPEEEIATQTAAFEAAVARLEERMVMPARRVAATAVAQGHDAWGAPDEPAPEMADVAPPEDEEWAEAVDDAHIPNSAWDAPAIDMTWDEATEQWHDPSLDPARLERLPPPRPADPRLPDDWHDRVSAAVADDQAPTAYPEPDPEPRRGRAPSPVQSEESFEEETALEVDEPPAALRDEPAPRRRRRTQRRGAAEAGPLPSELDTRAQDRPAEPRGRRREAGGLRGLAARFRPHRDDDPLAAFVAPEEGRRRKAPARAETSAPARRRGSPTRWLMGGLAVMTVAIIGWSATVFLPLLFPPAPSTETAAVATEEAPAQPARQVRSVAPAAPGSDIARTVLLFNGENPTVFESGPDNPVRFEGDGGAGVARVTSSASAGGVRAVVGPGLAQRLGGQRVRLVMVVRAASENGADSIRLAYQRGGGAISDWQVSKLPADFEPVTILWDIPEATTRGSDFVLIEPGIPGDGTAAEIKSIRFEILS